MNLQFYNPYSNLDISGRSDLSFSKRESPRYLSTKGVVLIICLVFFWRNVALAEENKLDVVVRPNEPIEANSIALFDVEKSSGSGSLLFSWNFGDGKKTEYDSDSSASHRFEEPGRYVVIVKITDGNRVASSSFIQTVHNPLTEGTVVSSSTMAYDEENERLYVVNRDNDSITAIDTRVYQVLFEVDVADEPRGLAYDRKRDALWVVSAGDHILAEIDAATGVSKGQFLMPASSRPVAVAIDPKSRNAYVTLQATGELLRFNLNSRQIDNIVSCGAWPGSIAISHDSKYVYVAQWISDSKIGKVRAYDADPLSLTFTYELEADMGPDGEASGRGIPNYLSGVTISPDGLTAAIPSKKDNVDRGIRKDGLPANFENTVRPIVSFLNLEQQNEDISGRVDLNNREGPSSVIYSHVGDYVFVALRGANMVEVLDTYSKNGVAALRDVGFVPQALALSLDGRLFIHSYVSRTVTVYDVRSILNSSAFDARRVASVSTVQREVLTPEQHLGQKVFFGAGDPRMSKDGYIACSSCHLDGLHDGRVWDFSAEGEGLRNTKSLLGTAGTRHGRVHWTGNYDEIQDFERAIRVRFSGTGFMDDSDWRIAEATSPLEYQASGVSNELDALSAYISTFDEVHNSPYRQSDGSLTQDAELGYEIFKKIGCENCHAPPYFTDSPSGRLHDIGTIRETSGGRLGVEPLEGIDTPSLLGVWESAPYFHDGSAKTLFEVFEKSVLKSALTEELSEREKIALVRFLLELDGRPLDSRDGDEKGGAGSESHKSGTEASSSQPKQGCRIQDSSSSGMLASVFLFTILFVLARAKSEGEWSVVVLSKLFVAGGIGRRGRLVTSLLYCRRWKVSLIPRRESTPDVVRRPGRNQKEETRGC